MINNDILFHDGTSQFCCYDNVQKTYNLILRAKKGTITGAFVCVNGKEQGMEFEKSDTMFEYYKVALKEDEKLYSYYFRAITKEGVIVRNKVDSPSKQTLIKRLKAGELLPIDIVQVGYGSGKKYSIRECSYG